MADAANPALTCDLVVVGAGPVGLYATYYAGFRGLKVVVVDSLTEVGGQISALFPEKDVFDVAGFPAVRGRELVARLREQAATADPQYLLGRTAISIEALGEGGLEVELDDGTRLTTGATLLCAGVGRFEPRRLLVADEWVGRGVEFFVRDRERYRGLDVVVTGGGDSAVDWALHLQPVARSVALVHRRANLRAHEASIAQLHRSRVEVLTEAQVSGVFGIHHVEAVEIHCSSGTSHRRPADALVCALGFVADLGPLAWWGIEVVDRRIRVDPTMRTNRDRVFAAGDVCDYPGKVRLLAVGFGEAAIAVNHVAALLRDDCEVTPGHSSDRPDGHDRWAPRPQGRPPTAQPGPVLDFSAQVAGI